MNYYEHHIGDYAQATAHLSFVEDAAYSRLIRKYYAEEKPLPADIKAVQRLVGARTKEERQAVADILEEFFVLEADGWHNKRCDAEITRFREGAEERQAARTNEKERQRRHREERRELFEQLRQIGIVPKWDTPTATLREMLVSAPVTQPVTVTGAGTSRPVTPPVTPDNTATQAPTPSPLSIQPSVSARAGAPVGGTRAGQVCARMKVAGIQDVNPSHPKLLTLIDMGITDDEFASAAADAAAKGKGFAYALATAEGRRRDANSGRGEGCASRRPGNLDGIDYRKGVADDGTF